MIISITTSALANSRPSAIGANTIEIDYGVTHTFTLENFTTETSPEYSDPENDALYFLYISSLPDNGDLYLDEDLVSVGDEILSGDISTGNFTYVPDDTITDATTVSFQFDIADAGSTTVSGLNDGIMTINIAEEENYPPDSVGDNSLSFDYAETIIFTESNFTTETTPAYNDPEGDPAYELKILSLPSSGKLYINNVPVGVNQHILFTQIAAGYFSYVPDTSVTDAASYSFTFSISDEGSKEFTK